MTADLTPTTDAIDDLLEQHADAAAAFQVDGTQQSLDRRMSAADRIRDLLAERDATIAQLRDQLAKVDIAHDRALAIHRPGIQNPGSCYECSLLAHPEDVPWPCRTAQALGIEASGTTAGGDNRG